jgi:two-component system chemotaxis response regulator CheY
VLLVDDEDMVRHSLARCLHRFGFEVTTAASAPDALTAMGHREFDAIVTDQHMPGMSGGQLIEQALLKDPSLRHRILVTSGDLENEATRRVVAATGCKAIQKPFEIELFVSAVLAATQGVRSDR